jgi:type III pantothenate kinase
MNLLVDIGNTRLKWCLLDEENMLAEGTHLCVDVVGMEPPMQLRSMLIQPDTIGAVWVSSVGPESVLDWLLNHWCNKVESARINIVAVTEFSAGIYNAYRDHQKLGVDRWVAAIGARAQIPTGDLLVIDAGTAVTIDWLSAENVFEGGAILPGAQLMHDALVGNTAGIVSEFKDTVQIVGKTTVECVNSGVSFGLIGAIERVVFEMNKMIDRPAKLALTGGAAQMLHKHLGIETEVFPHLVLSGLKVLAKQAEAM